MCYSVRVVSVIYVVYACNLLSAIELSVHPPVTLCHTACIVPFKFFELNYLNYIAEALERSFKNALHCLSLADLVISSRGFSKIELHSATTREPSCFLFLEDQSRKIRLELGITKKKKTKTEQLTVDLPLMSVYSMASSPCS